MRRILRDRRITGVVATAGATYAARASGIVVSLITIPSARSYLGPEVFGAWMVISSLSGVLAFADLGLGNGLINLVTRAAAAEDREGMDAVVASAYAAMLVLAGVVAVATATMAAGGFLGGALGLRHVSNSDSVATAIVVYLLLFALNLPAGLIQKVQLGLQRGYLSSAWQIVGAAVTLVTVPVAITLRQPLPVLVLCLFGSQVLSNVLNTAHALARKSWFTVSFKRVTARSVLRVIRTGLLFFVLQATVAIAYQSDGLVLARYLGPTEAGNYLIGQKVFAIGTMLVASGLSGLWPAFGDAVARGDAPWLRAVMRRGAVLVLCLSSAVSLLLVGFFQRLTTWWLNDARVVPTALLVCLATWTVIDALGSFAASFFNGANVVRFQILVASALAVTAFAAKIALVQVLGAVGVVLATIVAYCVVSVPAQIFFLRRYFRSLAPGNASRSREHACTADGSGTAG